MKQVCQLGFLILAEKKSLRVRTENAENKGKNANIPRCFLRGIRAIGVRGFAAPGIQGRLRRPHGIWLASQG